METSKQKYWRAHLERASSSGQSIASYCKVNGVSVTSLYKWKRRLEGSHLAESGFDEVEVTNQEADPGRDSKWMLDLGLLDHSILCSLVQALVGQPHA
jgi:hypothetical protein